MQPTPKKVVIVGGGFAGLNLMKALWNDRRFEVKLVDQNNYHFFPPLLYQVAMAFIEPSNISYPFRKMFQEKINMRFHLGCFIRVNPETNTIETDTGTLEYDYLVLALGTETNYFGLENVKRNALPMKTVNNALNLRNYLLLNMEKAVRTADKEEREKLLNVVIAGGGPTGVEIAGMLAELNHNIGAIEYPELKNVVTIPIYLVDASPSLLGPMSKKSQQEAAKVLTRLGVKIILDTAVKDYVDGNVFLSNGVTIPTNALIWASGVIAREVPGLPSDITGRGRRIMVDEFNRVKGMKNVFAIGDICLQTTDKNYPNGHPQLAQVAIQQGKLLAANLKRQLIDEPMKPFQYKDKGTMAIISKYKAVADLPNAFFKGFFAWLMWLFIHLIPIAGFRNKVKLALNWLWAFVTNDPTLRLVFRPEKPDAK